MRIAEGLNESAKNWWWQVLLNHVYHCKFKYFNCEEMKAEITNTKTNKNI